MNKKDVLQLYREVKRRKTRIASKSQKNAKKRGCSTCGKVTWKPYS